MENLIRRGEAQDLLKCYTQKNNLGHTPYEIVSNLPPAGPKWISVEEQLPPLNQEVLVYAAGKDSVIEPTIEKSHRFIFSFFPGGSGIVQWFAPFHYFHTNYQITHWMPLPEPPTEEHDER